VSPIWPVRRWWHQSLIEATDRRGGGLVLECNGGQVQRLLPPGVDFRGCHTPQQRFEHGVANEVQLLRHEFVVEQRVREELSLRPREGTEVKEGHICGGKEEDTNSKKQSQQEISKEKRLTQGLSDVKSHKRIWRGNQAVCAEAGSKGGLEEAVEPVIELQHNKDVCLQTPKDLLRKRRGAHNRVAPLDEVGTEERVLRHESH